LLALFQQRRAIISRCFYLAVLAPLLPYLLAEESNRRFELSHGLTAANIAGSPQPQSPDAMRKRFAGRGGVHVNPCAYNDVQTFECFQFDWGTIYVPPFPLALPGTSTRIPGKGNVPDYRWVPVNLVQNGAREFDSLRQSSASGHPISCADLSCWVVIEEIVLGQAIGETSYAACKVVRINATFGAPEQCRQVAITSQGNTWLYAVTGSNYSLPSLGRPDFSLRLRAGPPQYAPPSKASLSKALAEGLRAPPLVYEVQQSDDSVQAIASYRVSPLLKNNWRETVTVTFTLRDLNESPRGIGVTLATTFLVNRQNSGKEDYHPASAVQETQLLDQLRTVMNRAATAVCKQVIQIASDEVSCVQ
jgi:hypothetical protein